MSNHFAVSVRPRVQYAPVSPGSGAPTRHESFKRAGAERQPGGGSISGETGFYLRRSWALVERMRAAVAARRGDDSGL